MPNKSDIAVHLLGMEQSFQELLKHTSNLLRIIDDLLPDGNSNSIKSRQSYIKAKEFMNERDQ